MLEAFPRNQRIAMKASKGPGKSTVLAWLAWNFMMTRPHPKIAATSITAENLADNLWAEMCEMAWQIAILQSQFEWQKTRIIYKERPETWWMSARTWPKGGTAQDQANTLAGLHAEYIHVHLLDESGGMPDAVMASAEAALAACIEGHIIQAGNPTHLSGPLYRACTIERRLWKVYEINWRPGRSNAVSTSVDVEWARETDREMYGRDNPYVLVNVFGQFPPSSLNRADWSGRMHGSDEAQLSRVGLAWNGADTWCGCGALW